MFSRTMSSLSTSQQRALDNFREYLRIPSVHPDVNYDPCVTFLQKQATSLDLPLKIYHVVPKKPIIVLTWVGTEPDLPAILLNSHTDVVPVFEDKWTYKPFEAEIHDGKIYARGTQDTKCVGIQYLEAIRKLKEEGVRLKRTLHVSFVPDEETGGADGMRKFVHTKDFQDLKVGFALDEGTASPNEKFALFYGEKCIWHMRFHCPGNPGHGSLLLENTAGEKVTYLLSKLYAFRDETKKKLKENPTWTIGNVTTVNLTMMKGGVQTNVIPPEFTITVDCRITPGTDLTKMEEMLNQWCQEAGTGVSIEYVQKDPLLPLTKLDSTNPFWTAFKKATDDMGLALKPMICPGGTDSRYVRGIGIPALGFSPMNNTPVLLHNHDEYLGVETFLKGIDIYCKILAAIANV